MGIAPPLLSLPQAKQIFRSRFGRSETMTLGSWYTEAEVNAVAVSFLDHVAAKGNMQAKIERWHDSLPTDLP